MKTFLWCLTAVLAIGISTSAPVLAAESNGGARSSEARVVTQAEFARQLVQNLGLARFLPANASDRDYFALLMQNGIVPKGGWNPSALVTESVLARTVVQALGLQTEIKDPENDSEWVAQLKKILAGGDVDTVNALTHMGFLAQPVGNQGFVVSTDPLDKKPPLGNSNDQLMGVELNVIRLVLTYVRAQPPPQTPRPPPSPPPEDHGENPTPA